MPREFRFILCVCAVWFSVTTTTAASPATVDHSVYASLLREHVREGLVDYAALKSDARLPSYLAALERTDLSRLPRDELLAYWINTYNAVTLKLMADSWPVASIMKLNNGKPWDVPLFTPRGSSAPITLNHLEHEIIRKQFNEPRIHFALVCAAISCPPLISEPYLATTLESQLDRQTRAFLHDSRSNRYDAAAHTLRLSPLFDWYAVDFGGEPGVFGYVLPYLSAADQRLISLHKRHPAIVFTHYDWTPNAVK